MARRARCDLRLLRYPRCSRPAAIDFPKFLARRFIEISNHGDDILSDRAQRANFGLIVDVDPGSANRIRSPGGRWVPSGGIKPRGFYSGVDGATLHVVDLIKRLFLDESTTDDANITNNKIRSQVDGFSNLMFATPGSSSVRLTD